MLTAANGAAITTGPKRALTLYLQDSQSAIHQCNFTFITADVEGPILGIDFFRKFHITDDPVAACVCCSGGTTFPGILSLSLNNPVLAALPADIQPVITTFSDVCSTQKSMPPPVVDVQHFLQTEGSPVTSRFRRLDSDKLGSAKEIFATWEWDGVVRRSDSQWSSPLHMVKKKEAGGRAETSAASTLPL